MNDDNGTYRPNCLSSPKGLHIANSATHNHLYAPPLESPLTLIGRLTTCESLSIHSAFLPFSILFTICSSYSLVFVFWLV